MTKRTPAAALPVFASVLFLALFITFATADVAVLEPKCVSNATDCTCSEHPGSGVCTQPLAGGKCLDGECSDSMRCDCLGFELCAINPCGRWEATPPAVRSLESEFQCSYVDGGAQCRTHTTFVDTVQGSTNAKDAAVVAVDELSVDERESTAVLSASFVYQSEALTIFRKLEAQPENQNELITDFELEDVKVDVAQTVLAVEEISVALNQVIAHTKLAFESEGRARTFLKAAKREEASAVKLETEESVLAIEAEKAKKKCVTCDSLKEKIKRHRQARRDAAKAAGTWAKNARDARKEGRKARRNAEAKQLTAKEAKERCIRKSEKILARLSLP